jgi:hypothetical protein
MNETIQLPDILIITVFIVWAFLSVLSQRTTKFKNKIKAKDVLNILPNYKFFCPNPTKFDYHLYYKKATVNNLSGEWEKINIGKRIPIVCVLWNPLKRERKVFFKTVKTIKKFNDKKNINPRSHIYQLLSGFIINYTGSKDLPPFKITHSQSLNTQAEEKVLYTSV